MRSSRANTHAFVQAGPSASSIRISSARDSKWLVKVVYTLATKTFFLSKFSLLQNRISKSTLITVPISFRDAKVHKRCRWL